jgi:predicted unusual protein kinase regulating ubiquinone biosynthesis (AarF/ABC1/UbiB family)
MAGLGVTLGPMTLEMLIEEADDPGVVRELELTTARRAVHRVLAMFESDYQGLDHTALSCGWAPGISDDQRDELEEDCCAFARDMADTTLKDLELLLRDELEDPEVPGPSN